jgi:hypothetical protein
MRELEHANRREQERRRQTPAKQFDGCVASGDVPKRAWDERGSFKGAPVRAHRFLGAGAASHIRERLCAHSRLSPLLE